MKLILRSTINFIDYMQIYIKLYFVQFRAVAKLFRSMTAEKERKQRDNKL